MSPIIDRKKRFAKLAENGIQAVNCKHNVGNWAVVGGKAQAFISTH